MDISYKFANGVFYPSDIEYKSIPESAIDVTYEEYAKAMRRPTGYNFTVDKEGIVTLIEHVISEEEWKLDIEAQLALLRQRADNEIGWRQYAVERGKATEEEVVALIKWQDYKLELMRVDTSNPVLPTIPE
ncbi:TPA: tail fiber assembly protein [Escherichia coli]|uniref:tail fiber assembly protein n=1 Tax=Escherichia coli TaxID=562 RepID=UPI0004471646|nr:tail fiber assembly protein [Escherichia coli]EEZ6620244.1 tail fiber assembly protein [Escherichia coli O7]EEX2881443.1 phage tail protein [Escherichia coli]EFA5239734.1 phage tail protein [Escherichia coli]EFB2518415.1 tail fiber assembly protein [Escherichia coli]EFB2943988.1 tail fiber assembly protein [Escherichia coli]